MAADTESLTPLLYIGQRALLGKYKAQFVCLFVSVLVTKRETSTSYCSKNSGVSHSELSLYNTPCKGSIGRVGNSVFTV